MSGVHAFYSAKDIPGQNNFAAPLMFMGDVEEIFVGVDSEIKFFGQPAGIVLAETMALANYAATKVKITYMDVIKGQGMMSMARSILGQFIGDSSRPVLPTINDVIAMGATDRFQDAGFQKTASQYGKSFLKYLFGCTFLNVIWFRRSQRNPYAEREFRHRIAVPLHNGSPDYGLYSLRKCSRGVFGHPVDRLHQHRGRPMPRNF